MASFWVSKLRFWGRARRIQSSRLGITRHAPQRIIVGPIVFLFVALFSQNLYASPFISEIFFPGASEYPGSGIEVSGIGAEGASLLVVNARPDGRLVIRRKYEISPPGTALLADLGTLQAFQTTPDISSAGVEIPAFSLPLSDPIALAVFAGSTPLQVGTALSQPATVSFSLAANPIVDWITLSPESSLAEAQASVFSIDQGLAEALGIDELDRPIAPTLGVTTLARPSIGGVPQLDLLLPGTIGQGISGASANLVDFPASPGAANPSTVAAPTILPAPTGLAVWGITGLWLAQRSPKRESRCESAS